MGFGLAFLAAVFFFAGLTGSAVAVVVVAAEAGAFAAHGNTSGLPVLPALAAFSSSFFSNASDRQRAFVAFPASFVPAATQMQAVFVLQTSCVRLRQTDFVDFLAALSGVADAVVVAAAASAGGAGAALASGAAAAAFFAFFFFFTGGVGVACADCDGAASAGASLGGEALSVGCVIGSNRP